MKKIVKIVVVLVLILLIVGVGAGYFFLRSKMPDYTAEVSLEGAEDEILVQRDERGVAHIQAKSFEDLALAQGYVHAQERLWQMETHRRAIAGTVSEIVGEDMLEMDQLMRTLGLSRVNEELAEETSAESMAIMQNYADGVNAFLEKDKLPLEMSLLGFEPEPWTAEDSLGIIVLLAYNLGGNWMEETARASLEEELEPHLFEELMPPYEDWDTPKVWTEEQAAAMQVDKERGVFRHATERNRELMAQKEKIMPRLGSNSWVVSPELSASEEAVLANDPHLQIDFPSIWYENRLEEEEGINLYGWSVPGAPGIVIGNNQHIAWGLTNIGDVQDLFLEEQHPDDPHKFKYDEDWYEAEVIKEEIVVDGKDEPVEHEVIITRNGPLVHEDPPMSLKWTAYDFEGSTADAIFEVNKSRNWEEFTDALESFSMPSQCIVYADVEGNIGFRVTGNLPIRKKGLGLTPSPGWDPDYGWEGYIPMDDLPELYNPPDEYIVTANHLVAGDDYPYPITIDCAPPYRMQRIVDVLENGDSFDVEDFKELQNDWYNQHAAERLPDFIRAIEDHRNEMDQLEQKGLELIQEWVVEPVNLPEKAGPAIFQVWYLNFMEEVFKDTMGDELYQTFLERDYLAYNALENLLEEGEAEWFDPGLEELLRESFSRSIDQLVEELGDEPSHWEWGHLQTISFDHLMGEVALLRPLLCRGPYPYGGDHMTVGRAAYSLDNPFQVNSIAGMRFISVMREEGVESYGIIAGGQSGHPLSSHYDDQLDYWLEGKYYSLNFTPEELENQETRGLKINP